MKEILFRGQARRKGEKIINGKGDKCDSHWVYGEITQFNVKNNKAIIHQNKPSICQYTVYTDTVGEYSGLTDVNNHKIFEGDIVRILDNQIGVVVKCWGTFGIEIKPSIDYDYLALEIEEITGCDNHPSFCHCDNFISLHELMWNYNQEDNSCYVIEIIRNIYDNSDLLFSYETTLEIVSNAIQAIKHMTPQQDNALAITEKALEKQIPASIKVWNGQCSCPTCNKLFGNRSDIEKKIGWDMQYCKFCGQKLDWSDINE